MNDNDILNEFPKKYQPIIKFLHKHGIIQVMDISDMDHIRVTFDTSLGYFGSDEMKEVLKILGGTEVNYYGSDKMASGQPEICIEYKVKKWWV